jgi:thiol:disulfide interchange protein DsbD
MKKLFALLLFCVTLAAAAQDLLEPEKAFRMQARALDAQTLEVRFAIADGYYMYRERFKFALEEPGSA